MFFIVVVNALVQGGSVAWLTQKLGLQSKEPPAPQAVLAIESRQPLQGELMSFYIDEALVVTGVPLEDLPFPEGAAVALIIRGNRAGAAGAGHRAPGGRPRARDRAAGGPAVHPADVRKAGGGVGDMRNSLIRRIGTLKNPL